MAQESLYRIAAGAMLLLMVPIGLPYRLRAARTGEPISRRGEGLVILVGLRASAILWGVCVVAWLIDPGLLPGPRLALPEAARVAGVAFALSVPPLLAWVFSSLGMNVTDTVVVRRNATLVTRGPYRWVRHPMYGCVALVFLALALLTASVLCAALGSLVLAFLALRTPIEEARLVERFGDAYRDYGARTGRFVPRWRLR